MSLTQAVVIARASPAHLLAEIVATSGLLPVIFSLARTRRAGPGFIAAQLVGAAIALVLIRALYPDIGPADAQTVVLPHP